MSAELGQAYVQIMPTAKGIKTNLESALTGEVQSAGSGLGSKFGQFFSKNAKSLLTAGLVAGLAVAVKKGVNALKDGIKATAEYGDHVDKMSQKIGFTSDEYQKWDYVLGRAGTSVDKMAPVMKKLSTAAIENSEAFQQLGISQEEVQKMSPGELFSRTVTELSKMENQTERTALASKLLGRGATELGPLLNQGSKAIEEQMEIAEKYGMIMPESAVKASAAFQDSLLTMQMTMTGLKNRMMSEFLPAATKVTDGLAKVFAGDMSGLDEVSEGITGIIDKMAEMAPKVLEVGGSVVKALAGAVLSHTPEILSSIGNLFMSILTGISSHVPEIANVISTGIQGFISFIVTNGPTIIKAVLDLGSAILMGIGQAVASGIQWVVQNGPTLVTNFVESVKQNLPKIVQTGLDMLGKLIKGILNGIKNIPSAVGKLISSFNKSGNTQGKSVIQTGVSIVSNLVKGLISGVGAIVGAVGSLVLSAINRFLSGNWIGSAVQAVGKIVSGIASAVGTVVTAIGNLVKSAIEKFKSGQWLASGKDAINKIKEGISSVAESVKNALGSLADKAINFFKGKGWTSSGSDAGQKVSDGIKSKNGAAQSAGGGLGDNAIKGVNSKRGGMNSAGGSLGDNNNSGINSKAGGASSAGRNLGQSALNAISGFAGSAASAGANFGKSFVDNINAYGAAAGAAGRNLGNLASLGLNSTGGIFAGSPSKRSTRSGRWFAQGFMIGIQDEAKGAIEAATDLGAEAVKALDDNLDIVSMNFEKPNASIAPGSALGQVITLLSELVGKDVNVYLDGQKVSDELTPYINRNLGEVY